MSLQREKTDGKRWISIVAIPAVPGGGFAGEGERSFVEDIRVGELGMHGFGSPRVAGEKKEGRGLRVLLVGDGAGRERGRKHRLKK
ncbi:hypothetical protein HPP92_006553, partial [Vanilla planifolia]